MFSWTHCLANLTQNITGICDVLRMNMNKTPAQHRNTSEEYNAEPPAGVYWTPHFGGRRAILTTHIQLCRAWHKLGHNISRAVAEIKQFKLSAGYT